MDKRKRSGIRFEKRIKKAKEIFVFSARVFVGVCFCFLSLYYVALLAKNGSEVFYYAMAFASPGTAIEILNTAVFDKNFEEDFIDLSDEIPSSAAEEEPKEEAIEPEIPKNVPEVPENRRGKITEMQISASEGGIYLSFGRALIKNCTSHSTEKIKSMLKKEHSLFLSTEEENSPQVLLYHTHATEAFEPFDRGYFDLEESWRSTDPEENMIAVGDVLTSVLTQSGIGVIHDGTMHDNPGYTGSYQRSAVTISGYLEEYPEIKVCLDLHRDAMEPSETEIIKPTAVINGKKAAQIMIISCCDDGTMNMPDYWENLRFAAALADKLEELYPGICRPILFDYRRYNMDLSPGLLLIEIGSTGNTLDEAKYSAELLGNALLALLTE